MNILFHPALNDIIGTSKFSVPSVPEIEDGLNPIRRRVRPISTSPAPPHTHAAGMEADDPPVTGNIPGGS